MELQTAINTVRAIAVQLADADANVLSQFAVAFAEIVPAIGCKADYDQVRENFIEAYMERQGCSEKSAANRWTELRSIVGLQKPQSDEAARKAAVRKAKREADKANPKGKAEPDAPADAEDAAEQVLKLSAIELHLIAKIRAGQFTMAHDILRSIESAA